MYVLCCRRRNIGKSEDWDSESVWERAGDQLFIQLRQKSFTAILNLQIQRPCNLAENLKYLKMEKQKNMIDIQPKNPRNQT